MIPINSFSPQPLRQGFTPLCMLCSYATALYPFIQIPELLIVQEIAAFAGVTLNDPNAIVIIGDRLNVPRVGVSGYDWLEVVHKDCPTDALTKARQKAVFERVASVRELELKLKDRKASSVVSMNFTSTRLPHSMAVAFNQDHGFFVRDSATGQGLPQLPFVDAIGTTIEAAILQLDSNARLGECILITENP